MKVKCLTAECLFGSQRLRETTQLKKLMLGVMMSDRFHLDPLFLGLSVG